MPVRQGCSVFGVYTAGSGEAEAKADQDTAENEPTPPPPPKEKPARKRRWGSSQAKTTASKSRTSSLEISTDSLKGLIEDVRVPVEPVLELEAGETMFLEPEAEQDKRDVKIKRTVVMREGEEPTDDTRRVEASEGSQAAKKHSDSENEPPPAKKKSVEKVSKEVKKEVKQEVKTPVKEKPQPEPLKAVRRVSQPLVPADEPEAPSRELSPPRKPVSKIVHIINLVRPFTLGQLKQLLGRTGTLVNSGFWINSIKSHCYVTYEKEEEAIETRKALHGARWPQSNPKTLRVDFASKEEVVHSLWSEDALRRKEVHHPLDPSLRPNLKPNLRLQPVTDAHQPPSQTKSVKSALSANGTEARGQGRQRGALQGAPGQVEAPKVEEEPPAKLLDDLFRKTKATPCIYWLPLTEEQYQERQRTKKARMLERERQEREKSEEAVRRKPPDVHRRDGPPSPVRERAERDRQRERENENNRQRERERDRDRDRERDKERERQRDRDRSRDEDRDKRRTSRDRGRQERSRSRDRRRR
ncbi:hypothetical protein BaRGS_00009820 [Batillaria attramentaria]|uniref:RRM domain-containing protein n=1 Tax=Batillaria attramentaria TaxID=370345 RepID=A0ABD0LIA1_9CAEN